jgi:hypothetical protein
LGKLLFYLAHLQPLELAAFLTPAVKSREGLIRAVPEFQSWKTEMAYVACVTLETRRTVCALEIGDFV